MPDFESSFKNQQRVSLFFSNDFSSENLQLQTRQTGTSDNFGCPLTLPLPMENLLAGTYNKIVQQGPPDN